MKEKEDKHKEKYRKDAKAITHNLPPADRDLEKAHALLRNTARP